MGICSSCFRHEEKGDGTQQPTAENLEQHIAEISPQHIAEIPQQHIAEIPQQHTAKKTDQRAPKYPQKLPARTRSHEERTYTWNPTFEILERTTVKGPRDLVVEREAADAALREFMAPELYASEINSIKHILRGSESTVGTIALTPKRVTDPRRGRDTYFSICTV